MALPIEWSQVTARLDPTKYTIASVPKLLASRKRDPWAAMNGVRQSITAEMRRKLGLKA